MIIREQKAEVRAGFIGVVNYWKSENADDYGRFSERFEDFGMRIGVRD